MLLANHLWHMAARGSEGLRSSLSDNHHLRLDQQINAYRSAYLRGNVPGACAAIAALDHIFKQLTYDLGDLCEQAEGVLRPGLLRRPRVHPGRHRPATRLTTWQEKGGS